jgi:hypothetical protein
MVERIKMNSNEKQQAIIGSGEKFHRTRRITGYLVGSMDRWNSAKRCEERDRVKHTGVLSNEATNTDQDNHDSSNLKLPDAQ